MKKITHRYWLETWKYNVEQINICDLVYQEGLQLKSMLRVNRGLKSMLRDDA
jgi:hypothetical protein